MKNYLVPPRNDAEVIMFPPGIRINAAITLGAKLSIALSNGITISHQWPHKTYISGGMKMEVPNMKGCQILRYFWINGPGYFRVDYRNLNNEEVVFECDYS